MLLSKKIKENQKRLLRNADKIKEMSDLYYLGSDPTRLKIVFLLKINKEICPTDFSQILKISISAVSHQLKVLERLGLVKSFKMGKVVCYLLAKNLKAELLLKNLFKKL